MSLTVLQTDHVSFAPLQLPNGRRVRCQDSSPHVSTEANLLRQATLLGIFDRLHEVAVSMANGTAFWKLAQNIANLSSDARGYTCDLAKQRVEVVQQPRVGLRPGWRVVGTVIESNKSTTLPFSEGGSASPRAWIAAR